MFLGVNDPKLNQKNIQKQNKFKTLTFFIK